MTQTPMIERMARAIAGTLRDEFPAAMDEYDQMPGRAKQRYLDMAKAALTALQDPTPEMVDAGWNSAYDMDADLSHGAVYSLFTAMIKAIQEGE